jgi:transcriptional regulator NrdR family protein
MKIYCVKECPECGGNTNVINTRSVRVDGLVVRLRKCFDCDHTFETAEVPSKGLLILNDLEKRNQELEKENLKLKLKVKRIEQFMAAEFPKEE